MPPFSASGAKLYVPRVDPRFVIDFANDPALFMVNQVAPMLPVERQIAKYVKADDPERFRIVDIDDDTFPYGSDNRPARMQTFFDYGRYECVRRALEDHIDRDEASQTDVPALQEKKVRTLLTNLNLRKTVRLFNLLTTTANWPAANTSAAANTWDTSSVALGYIQRDCNLMRAAINNSQFGTDAQSRLVIIFDVEDALEIARNAEIQDWWKGTPSAQQGILGGPDFWSGVAFGLPQMLYGFETMVVNSRKVTSLRGSTDTAMPLLSKSAIVLTLDSPSTEGTNATVMCPTYEDFVIEEHDDNYRRKWLKAYANYDIIMTAGMSGYLLTDILP